MTIDRIPNIELQEAIRIKDWIGWKVGWMTGWYNPIDRLGDIVNPAHLGELIAIQGEFMQDQGRLVEQLGKRLNDFARGAAMQEVQKKG